MSREKLYKLAKLYRITYWRGIHFRTDDLEASWASLTENEIESCMAAIQTVLDEALLEEKSALLS